MINMATTGKGFAVVLQTDKENKVIPIIVATIEAQSIMVGFLKFKQTRPFFHDMFQDALEALNISIKHILIDSVNGDMFTSKMVLQQNDNIQTIDSRPSDAIALALRMDAKIFVDESVIDKAGSLLEDLDDIKLDADIPFKYTNLGEHFQGDITLEDIANIANIANASNAIFKKYLDLNQDHLSNITEPENKEMLNETFDNELNLQEQVEERSRDKLERLLKQAIKEERYEDAANYRDELNNYEDD